MEDNSLITCKICGKQSTRIYGAHLKSHGLTSDEYLKLYPGALLYTESDNKNTTKNSGKHMKQEKYKKMFSERIKGENNPNSKTKTTEEERKRRSPFSKSFIKYKDESEALDFARMIQKNIPAEKRPIRIEYYLNKGYTYEEAEKMLIERQKTFTLEKCIEKYGEEKGKIVYRDRQNNWQKSLIEGGKLKSGFSEISQVLFFKILNFYNVEDREFVYFAKKNQEYFISLKGQKFYQYDFTDKKKMKIIEYNSDMYHANPNLYESRDNPHPFRKWLKSEDIWKNDSEKINAAVSKGFEVLTIWDSEYISRPYKVLQDCLDFLNF